MLRIHFNPSATNMRLLLTWRRRHSVRKKRSDRNGRTSQTKKWRTQWFPSKNVYSRFHVFGIIFQAFIAFLAFKLDTQKQNNLQHQAQVGKQWNLQWWIDMYHRKPNHNWFAHSQRYVESKWCDALPKSSLLFYRIVANQATAVKLEKLNFILELNGINWK